MEIKYTVEMSISQDVLDKLKGNPAGLTIDDLIQTKIETALFPVCQKAILVYRPEEGKKPIDLYQTCPVCGHPWALHFSQIESRQVGMSDGGIATREIMIAPNPINCPQCVSQKKSCNEALKYKPNRGQIAEIPEDSTLPLEAPQEDYPFHHPRAPTKFPVPEVQADFQPPVESSLPSSQTHLDAESKGEDPIAKAIMELRDMVQKQGEQIAHLKRPRGRRRKVGKKKVNEPGKEIS